MNIDLFTFAIKGSRHQNTPQHSFVSEWQRQPNGAWMYKGYSPFSLSLSVSLFSLYVRCGKIAWLQAKHEVSFVFHSSKVTPEIFCRQAAPFQPIPDRPLPWNVHTETILKTSRWTIMNKSAATMDWPFIE
jgi:hypothetical protein